MLVCEQGVPDAVETITARQREPGPGEPNWPVPDVRCRYGVNGAQIILNAGCADFTGTFHQEVNGILAPADNETRCREHLTTPIDAGNWIRPGDDAGLLLTQHNWEWCNDCESWTDDLAAHNDETHDMTDEEDDENDDLDEPLDEPWEEPTDWANQTHPDVTTRAGQTLRWNPALQQYREVRPTPRTLHEAFPHD